MKLFSFFLILGTSGALLASCAPDQGTDTQRSLPTFNCEAGDPDWVRAKSFSPDVILPCNAGSTGICKTGYTYVSGTGWCQPNATP